MHSVNHRRSETGSPNRPAPKQWMRSPFLRARSNIRKRSQGRSRAGRASLSSAPGSASRRARMCPNGSRPCRAPDPVHDSFRRATGPGMETTPIRDRPLRRKVRKRESCNILMPDVSRAPVGLVGLDFHLVEIIGEEAVPRILQVLRAPRPAPAEEFEKAAWPCPSIIPRELRLTSARDISSVDRFRTHQLPSLFCISARFQVQLAPSGFSA